MTSTGNNDGGQRRARAGGELGANGEWYEGGKFIATTEDRIKTAPPAKRELTADEVAAAIGAVKVNAWLAARVDRFANVLAALEQPVVDQWGNPIPGSVDRFFGSLASQLRASGSLSPRQARFAVKAYLGRRVKANGDTWDALCDALTEEFQPS